MKGNARRPAAAAIGNHAFHAPRPANGSRRWSQVIAYAALLWAFCRPCAVAAHGQATAESIAHSNGFEAIAAPAGLSLDDVDGSFAPGAVLTARCPSVSANAAAPAQDAMVIVDTWRRPSGDVEAITHVHQNGPGELTLTNSSRAFASNADNTGRPSTATRTLCVADLADSHTLYTGFSDQARYPQIFLGTTEFSLSTATLKRLRRDGEAPLDYVQYDFVSPPGLWIPIQFSAVLKRVEATDIQYPMIVNDQPVMLPVMHLKGTFEFSGDESVREQLNARRIKNAGELYVLDDQQKPVLMLLRFGDSFQIQVVRITYPAERSKTPMEQQLATEKHAVTYGIYFDFNSDQVRAESQATLKEISDAMSRHPDWKLTIDGHTDNIGGDAKNLDLSRRRAASVRDLLINQYHVSKLRLRSAGYGASRPVADNSTLQGRARNRRVELSRK